MVPNCIVIDVSIDNTQKTWQASLRERRLTSRHERRRSFRQVDVFSNAVVVVIVVDGATAAASKIELKVIFYSSLSKLKQFFCFTDDDDDTSNQCDQIWRNFVTLAKG